MLIFAFDFRNHLIFFMDFLCAAYYVIIRLFL